MLGGVEIGDVVEVRKGVTLIGRRGTEVLAAEAVGRKAGERMVEADRFGERCGSEYRAGV